MPRKIRANLLLLCAMALLPGLDGCAHEPEALPLPEPSVEASALFDQRVKARFPPGSSLARLRTALATEQYIISDTTNPGALLPYAATRKAVNIVCQLAWTISWNTADDRVTAVAGQYHAVCP